MNSPKYLSGYPPALVAQVENLIRQNRLSEILLQRYPQPHTVRTDNALYEYVITLKNNYLRNSGQLSKVAYDNKIQVIQHALGTHTRISRVQGSQLTAKRELRVASIFKEMPLEFLRMIVVHELAHIKQRQHDKAFYQLCQHMETDYAQLELELRTYLYYLELGGKALWSGKINLPEPLLE